MKHLAANMPTPRRKARIEIIPLIDIMFFLLASFMLVSLSMIRLQGMQLTLPSKNAPPPPPSAKRPEIIQVQILTAGSYLMDKQPTSSDAVLLPIQHKLIKDKENNEDTRVFVNADKTATHGMVVEL